MDSTIPLPRTSTFATTSTATIPVQMKSCQGSRISQRRTRLGALFCKTVCPMVVAGCWGKWFDSPFKTVMLIKGGHALSSGGVSACGQTTSRRTLEQLRQSHTNLGHLAFWKAKNNEVVGQNTLVL